MAIRSSRSSAHTRTMPSAPTDASPRSVGAEHHRGDPASGTMEHQLLDSRLRIPQPHSAVAARRRHARPVGAEGDVRDRPGVPGECRHPFTGGDVADLGDPLVPKGRRNSAVPVESKTAKVAGVSMVLTTSPRSQSQILTLAVVGSSRSLLLRGVASKRPSGLKLTDVNQNPGSSTVASCVPARSTITTRVSSSPNWTTANRWPSLLHARSHVD